MTTQIYAADNQAGATFGSDTADGSLVIKTGAYGAKVNALTLDASGTPAFAQARTIGQVVTYQTGTMATGTTLIPADNTIPQNTEGDQYMSLAITPKSASSLLEITVSAYLSATGVGYLTAALFQDSTANSIAVASSIQRSTTDPMVLTFSHVMTSGTTSTTTFKIRAGSNGAGTVTFNGIGGVQYFGGVMASRITIKEYLP